MSPATHDAFAGRNVRGKQVRQKREIWDFNCTVLQLEYLVSSAS